MIRFDHDGTVTLIRDSDPTVTQTLAAGWTDADLTSAASAILDPPAVPAQTESYRFKVALRSFPSVTGDPTKTLRDDVDGAYSTWSGEDQDAWNAPEFYRSDARLIALAIALCGGDATKASSLLDQVFIKSQTVA